MKCSICVRETPEKILERHHLIPGNKKSEKIDVCVPCGDQIHILFTRNELKNEYNTLEKLLKSEKIQKWIKWIRKKNDFNVCMKEKKRA